MANNTVTRLPGGITNVREDNLFADLKKNDQTLYHERFEDFDAYVAADWVVTETQVAATQALAAGDGGLLLLTNTAADNDLVALQKTPEAWTFTVGKAMFFRARFKISDATQSDFVMGLQVIDTTPLDVTDGIYFLKVDGSTAIDIVSRKDATTGSTTATAIATLVSDTFISLGWYYDGAGKLLYAIDGTVKGSLTVTNFLPDSNVTVSFALQNGDAVARTMTVDYIYVAKER